MLELLHPNGVITARVDEDAGVSVRSQSQVILFYLRAEALEDPAIRGLGWG
jgi:hypothetical protein